MNKFESVHHLLKHQNKFIHTKFSKLVVLVNNSEISNLNSTKMTETLTFHLEKGDYKQFEEVI